MMFRVEGTGPEMAKITGYDFSREAAAQRAKDYILAGWPTVAVKPVTR